MAHWAKLDENNVVLQITVGNNHDQDEGYQWLIDNLGGRWVQTSYNNKIRGKFAGIGDVYDEELDLFIPPQPFESWSFDAENCVWVPPVLPPNEKDTFYWDEATSSWLIASFASVELLK